MAQASQGIGIVRSAAELFGIVLLRFRPLPRLWGAWLVAVNLGALLFIGHVEAQVAVAAVGAAVIAQALIYQRRRFVRILGTTHVLWVPMLAWMALRLGSIPAEDAEFRAWLVALMATNAVSLGVDARDAVRFIRGDRRPYYAW